MNIAKTWGIKGGYIANGRKHEIEFDMTTTAPNDVVVWGMPGVLSIVSFHI